MGYGYKVKEGDKVELKDFDPGHHDGLSEKEALRELDELGAKMANLQELMFAAGTHSLLIVLQGPDTSGKDGAIRRILSFSNVQSCRVCPFKAPSSLELKHDFLWRVHAVAPGKGDVAIFNRSHYEDVLVARVHKLVPKDVWKGRYKQINQFEELLTSNNTIILKFFLYISKAEQEQRLMAREADPDKSYKLNVGDWKERELWDEYIEADEDALSKCSTKDAPWRIIPANHKWYRDLAIIHTITKALEPYKAEWHEVLREQGIKEKAELLAYRASQAKG